MKLTQIKSCFKAPRVQTVVSQLFCMLVLGLYNKYLPEY